MAESTFRILLLGDVHFGESYRRSAKILAQRGYEGGLEHLSRFTEAADRVIANLETPLVDPDEHASPMAEVRSYLHWGDPEWTIATLKGLGVDAVSLANNHTLDRDVSGFLATLDVLAERNLPYIGAGRTRSEADEPFVIDLPAEVGGGRISLQASYSYQRSKDEFHFYAGEDSPGCAAVSPRRASRMTLPDVGPDALHVAFPHWGPTYRWRNERQVQTAEALIGSGYDLIVGHGAHCLQELERIDGAWVLYGIGNGHFQAPGRYARAADETGILPLSLWTMLEVTADGEGSRRVRLRLYPVKADNRETDFTPGPASPEQFDRVYDELRRRLEDSAGDSANPGIDADHDDLGHHLVVEAGVWPPNGRLSLS
ncbi:CapA family protein [Nesterenkonia marinintestina]|uniref:CapA family protein n=1 Tax=Nesterenkonia marinintestina TaxID=2979865 RepID=UPI0021C19163|nr:CapA family protein [Nesterenkonia sp. GX14115]